MRRAVEVCESVIGGSGTPLSGTVEKRMTALHEPVRLTSSQRDAAVGVAARAFFDDVLHSYVIPDPRERVRALPGVCSFAITHAMVHGEVYTTRDVRGVACWLPPGKTDFTIWRSLQTAFALLRTGFAFPRAMLSMGGEARRRNQAIMAHLSEVHKRVMTGPHWYLIILGVDPDFQRQGIGATLLQPVLARADAAGVPCYLETQTEGNVRFYEKLGFRVVHEGEVPGHGLRMWSMAR
jgi:ribosomal protein S18 acetylase RimI-like enzyme